MNLSSSAIIPPPRSPERSIRGCKRKLINIDPSVNSKSSKTASRSTAWREGKGIKIQEKENELKYLKEENGELDKKITSLFGYALALKSGKFEQRAIFKKQYLEKHFLDFFYLEKKVQDLSKQLQESHNTKEKRDRKAKYLGILTENIKFHEKILATRKKISEKLSLDINNNLK